MFPDPRGFRKMSGDTCPYIHIEGGVWMYSGVEGLS